MRTKSLARLYGRYEVRTRSLTAKFTTMLPVASEEMRACEPVHRDGRAYLIIRLQHLWGEFCRELIVRSAVGGCETRTGQMLPRATRVKRVLDISTVTNVQMAGPRSYWEDPSFTIGLANRLQIANYNTIDLSIASVSTILTNVKCVRNYVVHPNRFTSLKYLQMTSILGFKGLPPDQLLHQFLPGGVTIFDAWTSDLLGAAWNAVA